MPMGEPGCPELAACTASMHSVRMVLMASFSMAALSLATVRPVFMDNLLHRPTPPHRGPCPPGRLVLPRLDRRPVRRLPGRQDIAVMGGLRQAPFPGRGRGGAAEPAD